MREQALKISGEGVLGKGNGGMEGSEPGAGVEFLRNSKFRKWALSWPGVVRREGPFLKGVTLGSSTGKPL